MNDRMISDSKDWFGFPDDAKHDVCDDGSVYVGLVQILPVGSFRRDFDE